MSFGYATASGLEASSSNMLMQPNGDRRASQIQASILSVTQTIANCHDSVRRIEEMLRGPQVEPKGAEVGRAPSGIHGTLETLVQFATALQQRLAELEKSL